jgi:hypothetical protein
MMARAAGLPAIMAANSCGPGCAVDVNNIPQQPRQFAVVEPGGQHVHTPAFITAWLSAARRSSRVQSPLHGRRR